MRVHGHVWRTTYLYAHTYSIDGMHVLPVVMDALHPEELSTAMAGQTHAKCAVHGAVMCCSSPAGPPGLGSRPIISTHLLCCSPAHMLVLASSLCFSARVGASL